MPATLKGSPELKRRLIALRGGPKNAGREWADYTAAIARGMVPVRTGALRRSIRPGGATAATARVVGSYTANFVDAGSKAHDIFPKKAKRRRKATTPTFDPKKALKFSAGGRTFFRKRVHKPAITARPFKQRAAEEGLRRVDLVGALIDLWNKAA